MINFRKHFILILALLIAGPVTFAKKKKNKNSSTSQAETVQEKSRKSTIQEEAMFIDAMQSALLGNLNEALFKFKAIVKDDPLNYAAFFQIAKIYYELNELDKAESYNQAALNINPKYIWSYHLLVQIKATKYDYDGAAEAYSHLVELMPGDIETLVTWVAFLKGAGKFEEALKVLDKVEQITGMTEELLLAKLPLLKEIKKHDEAIRQINRQIAADSTQYQYYGYLGDVYYETEDYDHAIKAYEKVLELNPDNAIAYYSLSVLYDEKGDKEAKANILSSVMQSHSIELETKLDVLSLSMRHELSEEEKDTTLILNLFEDLAENHSDHSSVVSLLTEMYHMFKGPKKAISYLKEHINSIEPDIDLYLQLLSMMVSDDVMDDLYLYSQKGVEFFPEDPVFDFYSGVSAYADKKYDLAQRAYSNGLKKEFNNEALRLQMYIGLGDVSVELEDFDTGYDAYEKALEIDPNHATALNNYAYYLSVRNIELNRAEKMSKKSNLLEENNPAFQDTYAWIMYQKGLYKEALKWMEKALESSENPSDVLYDHHGDILIKLGKKAEAIKSWEKALELNQDKKETAEKIKMYQ